MGWYDGMESGFSNRLRQMIEASGGRLGVGSGYRSIEEQTYLWENSDKTGTWVAPPGKSNHNFGVAADLSYETDDAQQWAHDNAARFGLMFPMSWEPWHIEPIGVRDGTYVEGAGSDESYTKAPPGHVHPKDPTQWNSMEYQLLTLQELLTSGIGAIGGALAPAEAAASQQAAPSTAAQSAGEAAAPRQRGVM